MLLMVAPGMLYLIVFHYVPDLGNVIAFENYLPFIGFIHSQWVGLDNFQYLLTDRSILQAAVNTIELWVLQTIFDFPAPIILALVLNSLVSDRLRRAIQSVVTVPHFLAWTVIAALYNQVFGRLGSMNVMLTSAGLHPIDIVTNPALFKWMMTAQLIWKETGWGTVIYLAALLNIDAQLYEAAAVDGANWLRRMWHITLPGLMFIVSLFLILRVGLLTATGGEQILLQRQNVGATAGEVLYTYVYFHGLVGGQWSVAAAAGLLNGVIGLVLILASYRVARRFGFNIAPGPRAA
jgi:putative aldouronate transport system permease protein